MIKVSYNEKLIKISGHAGYADYGNDIVCASASSIIYTTINGILNIDKDAIKVSDKDTLIIEIIHDDNITNKLILNMIQLLTELANQYPKNIKISKGE